MNIHIDTFLYNENYQPNEEEHIYYTEMLSFVGQRLKPLESLIDAEEALNNSDGVTFIHIIDFPTKGYIRHYNYSPELTDKMKSCFSISDIEYMTKRIEGFIGRKGTGE